MHKCDENCPMRAKYDAEPKSLIGRLWRWHIGICPFWKKYLKSLDNEQQTELKDKYNL